MNTFSIRDSNNVIQSHLFMAVIWMILSYMDGYIDGLVLPSL